MTTKKNRLLVALLMVGVMVVTIFSINNQSQTVQNDLHPDVRLLNMAMVGNVQAVKQMLKDNVDPNTPPGPNDKGMTALMFAAWGGHADVVKLLVQSGANHNVISDSGGTALMYAAHVGNQDAVGALLDGRAYTDFQTANGHTALMLAVDADNTEVVKLLAKRGRAMKLRTSETRETPLMKAVKRGSLQTIDALLEENPSLESRDFEGKSALMFAVDRGDVEVVTRLLDRGANVFAMDANGNSVLRRARVRNRPEIVQLLLARAGQ